MCYLYACIVGERSFTVKFLLLWITFSGTKQVTRQEQNYMVKIIDTPTTITEFVYQAVTIKYENTCCRRPRKFGKACKKRT